MKKFKAVFLVSLFVLLIAFPCRAEMISEQQEIEIGLNGAQKLEAEYGIYEDIEQFARINRIGLSIVNVTERRNLKFTFKILNVDKVNALAFPGGFIYVTRGLLPHVNDQELAFVLGHEVTHVAKKHSIRQMEKQLMTDLGLVTLAALLNKGEVTEESMTTVKLASLVINSSYSREDEIEADRTSCQYMVYALGFNPHSGASFMRKLQKLGGEELPGFLNSLVGSHPLTEERIKIIEEECGKLGY